MCMAGNCCWGQPGVHGQGARAIATNVPACSYISPSTLSRGRTGFVLCTQNAMFERQRPGSLAVATSVATVS